MRENFFFKIKKGKLKPIEWDDYSHVISAGSTLFNKFHIVYSLIQIAKRHESTSESEPFDDIWNNFNQEEKNGCRQMFALQAISLTFEITENIAAMCFAYAEAIKYGKKFFPLLLRDYGCNSKLKNYMELGIDVKLGIADNLFKAIKDNSDLARIYLGLQVALLRDVIKNQKKISEIIKFRETYNKKYQKFKHTNSIINVSFLFDKPGGYSVSLSIPEYLNFDDKQVCIKDRLTLNKIDRTGKYHKILSESFFSPYQLQEDIIQTLNLLLDIWKQIRIRQHQNLFGEKLIDKTIPSFKM